MLLGLVACEAGAAQAKWKQTPMTGVGAKPQSRVRVLSHAMARYLHNPGTEKPQLEKNDSELMRHVLITNVYQLGLNSPITLKGVALCQT